MSELDEGEHDVTELSASFRPIDQSRSARLALHWATGDEESFHFTMAEVMTDEDPAATPGVLFALVALASSLAIAALPDDYADVLRASILHFVQAGDAATD